MPLAGKRVLVSAGPTYEAIDPVRYIGNHSSGKMGYAIAQAFAAQGAEVTLVSGPTTLHAPHLRINTHLVTTAQEMYEACMKYFTNCDVTVMAAAVADYTPAEPADRKMKKKSGDLTLQLKRTPDILGAMGQKKQKTQVLVGFALETDHEEAHAREKRKRKKLDFIVLNTLQAPGSGFRHDTNKVTFIDRRGRMKRFPLMSKQEVAEAIVKQTMRYLP